MNLNTQVRGRIFLRSVSFLVLIGAGCSTVGTKEGLNTQTSQRSIASVSAKLGLQCIANASIFSGANLEDDAAFENWVDHEVEQGLLTREEASQLNSLSLSERPKPLALALAEAYTYGQNLAVEFDQLTKKGHSLQRIMRESDTYSRLQALFFTKHELLDLVAREFERSFVEEMSAQLARVTAQPAGGLDAASLVNLGVQNFLASVRSEIESRSKDPRYATLALAEIEEGLAELSVLSRGCGTKTLRPAAESVKGSDKVIAAAKSLPKVATAYRFFQPRAGSPGLNVESIVNKRAKGIKQAQDEEVNREPQSVAAGKVIYPDEDPRYSGPGNIYGNTFPKGAWALTFDDGPLSPQTGTVLKNLKKHDVKATFFVLSQQITRENCKGIGPRIMKSRPGRVYPELVLQEQADGHSVASHSYYHSQSSKATPDELRCEVVTSGDKFKSILGVRPAYFRLPYGEGVSSRKVRKWIADAGMVHVHWTVDTLDWNDKDPESIYRRTLSQMKSGRGIILFHDVHAQSVIASEKVMAYLKDPANKLRAVTIPEIVDELNNASTSGK